MAAIGEWSVPLLDFAGLEILTLLVALVLVQLLQPLFVTTWQSALPQKASPAKGDEASEFDATSDDEDAMSTSAGSSAGSDASGSEAEEDGHRISVAGLLSLRSAADSAPHGGLRAAHVGPQMGPLAMKRGGCPCKASGHSKRMKSLADYRLKPALWIPKLGALHEGTEASEVSPESPGEDILRVCRAMSQVFSEAGEEFAPPVGIVFQGVFRETRRALREAQEELVAEEGTPGRGAFQGLFKDTRRAFQEAKEELGEPLQ